MYDPELRTKWFGCCLLSDAKPKAPGGDPKAPWLGAGVVAKAPKDDEPELAKDEPPPKIEFDPKADGLSAAIIKQNTIIINYCDLHFSQKQFRAKFNFFTRNISMT